MADPLLPGPLWLVGCGNMAGAMLGRWLEEGVDPAHVSVIRPSWYVLPSPGAKCLGVAVVTIISGADYLCGNVTPASVARIKQA